MKIIKSFMSLSKFELCLWFVSIAGVLASGIVSGFENKLEVCASLVGVTALIFVAKGNVLGQILTVIFGLFYGYISFLFRYYGEMITYIGMTDPIALLAVISWIRNPYDREKQEVKVNHLSLCETIIMFITSAAVTVIFYFILDFFNTANLMLSTLSVMTSFLASYLTFRRSPYYGLAYAANDIILIALWIYASFYTVDYLSMVMCFTMFFANDIYGYVNWTKMKKRQAQGK